MKKVHVTSISILHAAMCAAALAFALYSAACSGGGGGSGGGGAITAAGPLRSSTIALTSDDSRLVAVNRETNTLTVLLVRDPSGADQATKLAEVAVGQEPRSVAVSPDDARAYVTNAVSGTVSVVALEPPGLYSVVEEVAVGTEPRGVAVTPNGTRVYVANHTAGTVSVIDAATLAVTGEVELGGNPTAIAISNDGDRDDLDETVYVTQFYAEPIVGGPGEAFDDGKQGVVFAFPVAGGAQHKIVLSPLANAGFTADRRAFCPQITPGAHSGVYCPDLEEIDPDAAVLAQDPQAAYPNQLQSIVLREDLLYLPSIGAQPEPPVRFSVNVQALVHVAQASTATERADLHLNLNAQIRNEVQPVPAEGSLVRLFANDVVAIDADPAGRTFLIVSRGGNCVLKAGLDAAGRLSIGAPDVVRYQTGNLPNGVAISSDGARAYANNEANVSVTAIDLEHDAVLARDIPTGTPPAPGSFAHGVLVGKLAFATALGIPDTGVFGMPIRDIEPVDHRNKASADGWSSCASCHPDGLADGVTWIFATGPRQTVPLDAFFSKLNPADQRISNWSGIMGSITDFNNNARGVQGGKGFAGDPPPATIFNHGATQGASDALDAMTLWVQTVRAPILPAASDRMAETTGEILFADHCASCHAGAKWTKSQVVYNNNPTFDRDPNAGGVVLDPGVVNAGTQIVSFTDDGLTLKFLEGVGTFDANDPIELRGQGATSGQPALGGLGFNVPSLLGLRYHAPYLHNGKAQTLGEVFELHRLGATTIAAAFTPPELAGLEVFLNAIDGATPISVSETDLFLEAVGH